MAAGILGCGSVILGASETAGRMFEELDRAAAQHRGGLREGAPAGGAALFRRMQAVIFGMLGISPAQSRNASLEHADWA